MSRLFILLVICGCVRAGVPSVKGYYCQDPDTGHLHEVNKTWASSTFCGNYTCKIRQQNQDMEHAPSRTIINITRPEFKMEKIKEKLKEAAIININRPEFKMEKIKEQPKEAENNEATVAVKIDDLEKKHIYEKSNLIPPNLNSLILPLQNRANDRFLNGEEIKTISELLHTVKKSDLEAIIEIYNLAQDIYKEMDASTTDSAVKEAFQEVTGTDSSLLSSEMKNVKSEFTSYWYEPSGLHGFRKPADMNSEGSEYIPTSIRSYEPTPYSQAPLPQSTLPTRLTQPTITAQPTYSTQASSPTYFNGLLTNQDFGRLAYYYPMSNFQKMPSYYNQQPPYNLPPAAARMPCNPSCHKNHMPHINRENERPYNPVPKPLPSMLLPFPFASQTYNASAYPYSNYNNYYKGNPWNYYDYYRHIPYPPTFLPTGQVPKNADIINPEITEIQDKGTNLVDNGDKSVVSEKSKDNLKPWQTEPLSDAVLGEIRANIAERTKLLKLPYKKRIKLERVAKVIKLNHLDRQKREAVVKENETRESAEIKKLLETYIEKITCDTDTEPGFFRVGNMSEPFPACCPQKIKGP